ncbi:MAG TPA: hypothetical protein VK498_04995 [Ferruginibacter sp.]|nr:hypothetical protein [Ferruginibacter sp.]
MSDNKKYKGRQDRIRVDANDPNEVGYLRRKYPIFTSLAIKKAIIIHGPYRKRIEEVLEKVKGEYGCKRVYPTKRKE